MTQPIAGHRGFSRRTASLIAGVALVMLAPGMTAAHAQSLGYAPLEQQAFPPDETTNPAVAQHEDALLPDRLRRTIINFGTREAPGTIIIDTGNTYLYYVLGGGRALRYGVGVGREGFTWSGVQTVTRKAEWPDWHPPAQMIARQPYLPRFMAGGPGNPLGARAMYLGSSEYRIHGTNDPTTIGKFVSSGCIRLTNEDVADLFSRVQLGTKVVVLPKNGSLQARTAPDRRQVAAPRMTAVPSGRQAMSLSVAAVN
ncbi:MAG: L,D-transpeptidase [Bradyrhizobium sp.]